MKSKTSLALLLAALLAGAAGAQTTGLEPVAAPATTPALELADPPPVAGDPGAPALPPPLPPLQPLAPVQGVHVSLPRGFPFSKGENEISVTLGSDEEKEVVHQLGGTDVLKNVLLPIVLVGFITLCPVLIIAMVLFYRHRKSRAFLQTINGFVAKGQPIPPELLYKDGAKPAPTAKSDRRKGLMLTFTGLGLIFFFLADDGDSWGIGFIPMLIGIGYLLASKFAPRDGGDR